MVAVREGRILGVDWGEKRIGLALSDPTRTLATPLGVVTRRLGRRMPFRKIRALIEDRELSGIVVGLPLELDGSESDWTREVRRAGTVLADRLGVPVSFADERFTSVEAVDRVRSAGLPRSKRENRGRVDEAAAALILQSWLDREGAE